MNAYYCRPVRRATRELDPVQVIAIGGLIFAIVLAFALGLAQ